MYKIATDIFNIFERYCSNGCSASINGKKLKDCSSSDTGPIEFILGNWLVEAFDRGLYDDFYTPLFDEVVKEFEEYIKNNSCEYHMPDNMTIIITKN